jgi:hypothetical protein
MADDWEEYREVKDGWIQLFVIRVCYVMLCYVSETKKKVYREELDHVIGRVEQCLASRVGAPSPPAK